MDPTLLAILSIFGGAVVAGFFGFFGAWVQGRREHTRWIREQRLDAYLKLVALHNEITSAEIARAALRPDSKAGSNEYVNNLLVGLSERFPAAVAPLAILGPGPVNEAAEAVMGAFNEGDLPACRAAEQTLTGEMRKALRIRN